MNIAGVDMIKWLIICVSFGIPFLIYAVGNDSVPVKELQEVTVKGDRLLHKDGYQILLMDNRNRNFGTNALDAVSSLSMFITSLNSDKLTSWDRSEVFILINGLPSTAMDLRSYKGADIKNVEYYSIAPPQYMGFTDGPLVNVVLKKRHDRLYTGYFNAVNSVTTGFGTNQMALSYSDSLNQVKAGYYISYRDIRHISSHADYEIIPEWSSSYRNDEHYSGQYQTIYGSYQHYRVNHLFNAKLSFFIDPSKQISTGVQTYTERDEIRREADSTLLKSDVKTVALDLYYNYVFKNGAVVGVNIVNSFGRSHSESELSSLVGGTVNSMVHSRTYSLVANTFFMSKVLGWRYMFGSKYEYRHLHQAYSGITDCPYSHREFLSLGISKSIGDFSVVPTLALNVLAQSDGSVTKTHALPYLRLYVDWWPEGKLKGFSPQLTLMSRHTAPLLSMLTRSYTYKDYRYMAVGNPDLKTYWENSAKLNLCYFVPGRRDKIILRGESRYTKHPIASTLKVIDGNAYLQPSNLGHSFRHAFEVNGTWYPVKWLEISPYVEYYIHRYDALSHVREHYVRYGGTVSATCGDFTFILAANSPTRDFDGDLTIDGSAQYAAIVQYKWREWSFGAEFHYSGHNGRTYGMTDGFRVNETSDWHPLHNQVSITASYSFSIGRARSHGNKMFNESSSDNNGLNQYNTPTKPE